MQDAGIRPKSIPVFLLLREMIRPNEDCRSAAACREIAETFGFPYIFIHRCLKELIAKGWLTADIKSRTYTFIKLGPAYRKAVDETENETVFETANISINQHDSNNRETENVTRNGHTGVSRLGRSSPGFDVSLSGHLNNTKDTKSARTPTSKSPLEKFKDEFNRLCPRLIACRQLNDKRRKKISAELRENPDPLYWDEVFRVANKSAFMAGDNDRRWRANIDFIIRCHIEIVEGKYSRQNPAAPQMPRETQSAKQEEPYREPTPTELRDMHRETVLALGRCHLKSCQYCIKSAPAGRDLAEIPV